MQSHQLSLFIVGSHIHFNCVEWNIEASTSDSVAMELHWPCGAADCKLFLHRTCLPSSCMTCFDTCGTGNMCINVNSIVLSNDFIKTFSAFWPRQWRGSVFCFYGLYCVSDNLTLSTLSDHLISPKTWRLPPAHFSSGFPFGLVPRVCLHSYGRPLCLYWPL